MAIPKIECNDVDDFNCIATDIFDEFLMSLQDDLRFVRPVTDNDETEEGIDFLYTKRGTYLAEKRRERLSKVGCKYVDGDEIEIESHLYQEV